MLGLCIRCYNFIKDNFTNCELSRPCFKRKNLPKNIFGEPPTFVTCKSNATKFVVEKCKMKY